MMNKENNFDKTCSDRYISIKALSIQTRNLISTSLNPERYFPTDKGLQRDWHGLAELCGISGEKIPSLQQSSDPTGKVLDIWINQNKGESTISKLILFFEDINRFDLIEDITPLIEKDVNNYLNEEFVNCPVNDQLSGILTIDDVVRKNARLPLRTYDAFVLFAKDDTEFATGLIKTMENVYKLKLCEKDRDLVGGANEHDSIIQLISKRCRRLVVIVSPSFFNSPVEKYLFGFAQVEGIEQRRRKIIPCLIKPCDNLPADFRLYVTLNYERHLKIYDFYDKLFHSIKTVENPYLLSGNPDWKRSTETLEKNNVKFSSMMNINIQGPFSQNDKLGPKCTLSKEGNTSTSGITNSEENGRLKKKRSFYKKLKVAFTKRLDIPNNEGECKTPPDVGKVEKTTKKKLWKNLKKEAPAAS